jgi:hypothetical protein
VPSAAAAAAGAESGDSDSDEGGKNSQARREPVPALDELDDSKQQPDDEVERVLGHRCADGLFGLQKPSGNVVVQAVQMWR